jgi:hypothetical protein
VVAWDDGDTINVECESCGLPVAGFAREDCPLPILLAATKRGVRSSG